MIAVSRAARERAESLERAALARQVAAERRAEAVGEYFFYLHEETNFRFLNVLKPFHFVAKKKADAARSDAAARERAVLEAHAR